ncbi:hypothetical protein J3R82DRAFT_8941 [Butyriboletus roseoflavus]|nr:hypothetical protein J3R82DRAFT_8941 [Butyriboletus roseoflavus]
MGLEGIPLPITPPKTPSKNTGLHVRESWEHFSPTSPNGRKQTPHIPRRPETDARQSPRRRVGDHDTPERNHRQLGETIRCSTPASIESPLHSQESGSYLVDFSTLSYADTPRTNTKTPIRASRLSRTLLHPQISQQQTRGRLGQVVRNFVKRMLPPASGGRASTRSTSYPRTRRSGNVKGACGDSPSARTCQAEMTPRSNASGESAWTFASANSWVEAGGQGCLDYQATNRWSGFWH